jgi:hypothetical protein
MVHGAIAVTETEGIEIFEARRVPQSWAVKTIPSGTQRVSSRYRPCPADTATWQTFSVLDTTMPELGNGGESLKAKKPRPRDFRNPRVRA